MAENRARVYVDSINGSSRNERSFGMAASLAAVASSASQNHVDKTNMKKVLLLASIMSLLATTGCVSSSQEWRGHANNARFGGFTEEFTPAVTWAPRSEMHPPEMTSK